MLGLAMGLRGGQCWLQIALLVAALWLVTGLEYALVSPQERLPLFALLSSSPEQISYVPQLSNATLGAKLTQSTFTLEQPMGQFSHLKISDFDAIWLVVAHSNATQDFTAPQKPEDFPAPADLPQKGYYLTIRARPSLYLGNQTSNQLRVLRVGNNTVCSPTAKGCNYPLPGPGPYRVKFLVMSNERGPLAETEWSNDTHLLQAQTLQAVPGPRTAGTVVLITFLSVLLAVLLAALLALLVYTCFDTCRTISISVPEEPVCMRKYDTHHMFSSPATGGS
ncbi:PREDICTED: uroplakin-3b-like protein-like [Elephantulus edwardii]|uniref:uroplakin-3b-like protein-like n=1 Tax=Elephantulus edwardii TaxID=28737 RepID=UPI0003F08C16|nr:PREDICTED: uroplakin-3b-like protein-like [Elephantulus edwardii]